jgi:multicomponent Na+:H+ antiporter subunit C
VFFAAIFSVALYGIISSNNLLKKLISLGIMQTSVILMYVAIGFVKKDPLSPVYTENIGNYVDPVPQVLMLTAIVVGVAVTSVGLAMILRIKQHFNTINDGDLEKHFGD